MKYVLSIFSAVFLIACLAIFYAYSYNSSLPTLGWQPNGSGHQPFPYTDVTIAGMAMLLGIVFGSVYNSIKGMMGPVNLIHEFRKTLTSSHFAIALMTAPIIFAGIYLAAQSQPDRVISALLAFQNGFFCDSILRKGVPQIQVAATPAASISPPPVGRPGQN